MIPSAEDLTLLSQVVRDVARARRLSQEDAQDFTQSVQVKLLERDYDVFRRFHGRSSLRTYLTVAVTRMLLDWRNSLYGKWRASAAAVRLGDEAVCLERLVQRDGYTVQEAIEIIRVRQGAPSANALRDLADRIPWKPRRRLVSEDALRDVSATSFEDPVDAAERLRKQQRAKLALAVALRQLTAEDRWLIRVRYGQQRSVQVLARTLDVDPKRLYRRFDRTLQSLRRTLLAAGVTPER